MPVNRVGRIWLVAAILFVLGIAIVMGLRHRSGEPKDGHSVANTEPALSARSDDPPPAQTQAPSRHPAPISTAPAESRTISQPRQLADDPSQDGWDTEAFSSRAAEQLKHLGELLTESDKLTPAGLMAIVSEQFECGRLLPHELRSIYRDKTILIERPSDGSLAQDREKRFTDRPGLAEALHQLIQPLAGAKGRRCKFKIFKVEPVAEGVTTRQYVELAGEMSDGVLEQHATWDARWESQPNHEPRLRSLSVVEYQQVRTHLPQKTLFTDCTRSVLEHNSCYAEQFLRGYSYWLSANQQTSFTLYELIGFPGLAIGDVNGDGLDDLYVCQGQGLPNRLFLQRPDGTAEEVSHEWGVDWLEDCRSALLIDLDNDGRQDLVVAFQGGIIIAQNEQNQHFKIRTVIPSDQHLESLTAADYNSDGKLDIYATALTDSLLKQWLRNDASLLWPEVYHDANNGGRNMLLHNDIHSGIWKFTDVTREVGLDVNNRKFTHAAAWEDYDNDGDQDLYVANDFGRHNLYRNDNGHFIDVGSQAGAEDAASGMGITWGDYNRDGWMDTYVSNMWSSAGGRITLQPQFKSGASEEVKRRLQRMARGNTLLHNGGNGSFRDVSASAGVEMGRWAWASLFVDINNDGWEDLLVANGYITGEKPHDL